MKFFAPFLFAFAFVGSVLADTEKDDFKYGLRPDDAIFDPTDRLTSYQRKEISEPLARILFNEGIDVMIVVLPEIGDAPAKHIAKAFDDNWKKTAISAVVLYVPGAPGSPWIFPGDLINTAVAQDALKPSLEAAEKRAAAEPDDFGKIRAASIEAADVMRYWTGGTVLRTESIINERLTRQLAYEKQQGLIKLAAAVGAAGAIPIIVGLVFFITRIKRNSPRQFPTTRKISRLGAPYSGGNNAISRIH